MSWKKIVFLVFFAEAALIYMIVLGSLRTGTGDPVAVGPPAPAATVESGGTAEHVADTRTPTPNTATDTSASAVAYGSYTHPFTWRETTLGDDRLNGK